MWQRLSFSLLPSSPRLRRACVREQMRAARSRRRRITCLAATGYNAAQFRIFADVHLSRTRYNIYITQGAGPRKGRTKMMTYEQAAEATLHTWGYDVPVFRCGDRLTLDFVKSPDGLTLWHKARTINTTSCTVEQFEKEFEPMGRNFFEAHITKIEYALHMALEQQRRRGNV